MKFPQILLSLTLLPIVFLTACSSNKQPQGDTVMKRPDYYFLDPSARVESADEMISFESRHLLYGAVSNEERREREGHYYSFPWKASDKVSEAALLLQVRQANTGAEVHALRVPIEEVRRNNVTHVQIIGEPYALNGKVTAWRATIERNGSAVSSKQSYLWD